jgi:hypothetical protein
MPITITVGSTVVDFPIQGEAPAWANPIVQFAEAVAGIISQFAGPFDVSPQVINIDTSNPGVANTDIIPLNFPITNVRAAFIKYAIFRSTSTTTLAEAGNILIVYNPSNPVGNKWEITQNANGDAQFVFNITDNGQFQYTASTMTGTGYIARLSISAQALLQN